MRLFSSALIAIFFTGLMPANSAFAQQKAGTLEVKFQYLFGGSEDPSYHTAMWLEPEGNKPILTLYVSNELSTTQYKSGTICPDWVKLAGWSKAPKSLVDAVTGPTPDVGEGARTFDLGALKIPAGTYRFRMQVHIIEKYNILFQGKLVVGNSGQDVTIETLYLPSKPDIGTDVVKDVVVHYSPAATN